MNIYNRRFIRFAFIMRSFLCLRAVKIDGRGDGCVLSYVVYYTGPCFIIGGGIGLFFIFYKHNIKLVFVEFWVNRTVNFLLDFSSHS